MESGYEHETEMTEFFYRQNYARDRKRRWCWTASSLSSPRKLWGETQNKSGIGIGARLTASPIARHAVTVTLARLLVLLSLSTDFRGKERMLAVMLIIDVGSVHKPVAVLIASKPC